ncbi:MAG: hypothetical protein ACFFCS_01760 [Candidatus Hodarchaeota archaeon]
MMNVDGINDDWVLMRGLVYGAYIAVFLMVGIAYVIQGKRKGKKGERDILFGFGGFQVLWAISQFIRITRYEQIVIDIPGADAVVFKFFLTVSILAIFSLFFFYERVYRRTRYLLSITAITNVVFVFMLPPYHFIVVSVLPLLIYILQFVIILNLTRSSRRELKTLGSILFFGVFLMQMGVILSQNNAMFSMPVINGVIGPLVGLVGGLVFYIPLKIKYENLKQPWMFWIAFGIGTLSISSLGIVSHFILSEEISTTSLVLIIIYMVMVIIVLSRAIQDARVKVTCIAALPGSGRDVLGMFERPKQLTEEEISVSKEKRVCLVCKDGITRMNYACPGCGALYCKRCADVLAGMENACWSCNTPFDEAKPVQAVNKDELSGEMMVNGEKRAKKKT